MVAAIPVYSEIYQRAEHTNWSALRYFNFYRIVISGLFAVLSMAGKMPPNLSAPDAHVFTVTSLVYVGLAAAAQIAAEQQRFVYRFQVYGMVLVDIFAITLLMHAAGGVTSGIGMLLVVSVAGACLLASGRAAVLFAALASFAFLGETVFGMLYLGYSSANYTQAGLLGAACFGTAILASVLAERARHSEALAAKRAVDIENLSLLNEHIVRRMRAGIMVLDEASNVVLLNDAAAEILGRVAEVPASDLSDISESIDEDYRTWLRTGDNPENTISGPGNINALVSFTELGAARRGQLGTLVFLEDAAETRQRAQQLKLASLGRLTAGIAHEIRNPLGAISHAGQLLSESQDIAPQDRRLTDIIAEHTQRVNSIIENVLTIGRQRDVVSESFELRPWLENFSEELQDRFELAAKDIGFKWPDDPVIVTMDKSQLHQVLWNLCENGLRYSHTAPRLSFETGLTEVNGRPFLDVVDLGPGLDNTIADRLFEPFATGEAQGTGLGLYIARELCESNQASLRLESRDGGCRFRVTFAHPEKHQRFGDV